MPVVAFMLSSARWEFLRRILRMVNNDETRSTCVGHD